MSLPDRWRPALERTLIVLAAIALVLALVAAYARQSAVDSDQFANRATAALRDDSVRSLLAQKLTDEVVLKQQADLIAARPLIESVAADVVGGRAFTGLFRAAVRDVHRALFKRDRSTVTLTIADVGTVLAAALETVRPRLADQLRATERVEVVTRDIGTLSERLANLAETIRVIAIVLAVLSVLFAGGALLLAADRRDAIVRLGVAAAVAGVLLVVTYAVARSLAVGSVDGPEAQSAARAVWDAFLGDLRTEAWIVAGAGAVVAAAASSLVRPLPFGEPVRIAGRWLAREPERPVLRALRGAGFVVVGVATLVNRDAALALVATAAGVYLVYEGTSSILRVAYDAERHAETHRRVGPGLRVGPRRVATVLLPVLLIALVVAGFLGTGGTTTAAPAAGGCNGHEELCVRRLDRVALAATHNSMSVPLPNWFSSMQERPIGEQLRDGVRGLLIDTHYADMLPSGKVRTYFRSRDELRRRVKLDGVSPSSVDAALRIRDRLGFEGKGKRGMYLCHSFCELGATPLDSVLDDMRTFLVANPGAVVVVINQDYVRPEDFVQAVRDADLEELAYDGPVDGRWPSLREMIDANERVVFLAENHAGGAPWYRLAYESATNETVYSFKNVASLVGADALAASCDANRGPEDAPLFLLNHWVTTDPLPRPSDAVRANAYDALLGRARECRELRGHVPNLVAVNFYLEGELFRVVDELNRLR